MRLLTSPLVKCGFNVYSLMKSMALTGPFGYAVTELRSDCTPNTALPTTLPGLHQYCLGAFRRRNVFVAYVIRGSGMERT
jgi:hypothetical protein